jgi:uncharacterized protein with FMN-binding domain
MAHGTIVVTVTLVNGQFNDVRGQAQLPKQDGKSHNINGWALPELRNEALRARSANIGTVSKATETSDAYKTALQAALNQAGL